MNSVTEDLLLTVLAVIVGGFAMHLLGVEFISIVDDVARLIVEGR